MKKAGQHQTARLRHVGLTLVFFVARLDLCYSDWWERDKFLLRVHHHEGKRWGIKNKMGRTFIKQITDCIEHIFDIGGKDMLRKVIVYPCGDVGIQVVNIMRNIYAVEPAYLIDNHKCRYSENIHDFSFLQQLNTDEYVLFLASTNPNIYTELKKNALAYFTPERIIELRSMVIRQNCVRWKTEIGKYSYGPICCDHPLIKSIGAFCSFADGVDYVINHESRYITTHPIIYEGKHIEGYEYPFDSNSDRRYFLSGVDPKSEFVKKQRRATIGNDVWFGKNVMVTNSANIGNGVIAAAGAVITGDVPDYAVVAGVPARIIKYRYMPEQIAALNKIAWWSWTDDQIRERFVDFYLPIDEFIKKYL